MDFRSGHRSGRQHRQFFEGFGEELSEAVRIATRYGTADHNGETRRERNDRFGLDSPEPVIPEGGAYLWDWFWELSQERREGMNGPMPLSSRDIAAWCDISGNVVRPDEVAVLRRMDAAYRSALADEMRESMKRRESSHEAKPKG